MIPDYWVKHFYLYKMQLHLCQIAISDMSNEFYIVEYTCINLLRNKCKMGNLCWICMEIAIFS